MNRNLNKYFSVIQKKLEYSSIIKKSDLLFIKEKNSLKYKDESRNFSVTITKECLFLTVKFKSFFIKTKCSVFGDLKNTVFTSPEFHLDDSYYSLDFSTYFSNLYNLTGDKFIPVKTITYNLKSSKIYNIIHYQYPNKLNSYLTITDHPELLKFHSKYLINSEFNNEHYILNINDKNFKECFDSFILKFYFEKFPEKNIDDFKIESLIYY